MVNRYESNIISDDLCLPELSHFLSSVRSTSKRKGKKVVSELHCGLCGLSTLRDDFLIHSLSQHNGLAHVQGEPPITNDNEIRAAYAKVIKSGFLLSCNDCKKTFRSSSGLYRHSCFCNREKIHMLPKCDDLDTSLYCPPRKKRWRKSKNANIPVVKRKEDTPKKLVVEEWKRLEKKESWINCCLNGCVFKCKTVSQGLDHYNECAFLPANCSLFTCSKCHLQFDNENEVNLHVSKTSCSDHLSKTKERLNETTTLLSMCPKVPSYQTTVSLQGKLMQLLSLYRDQNSISDVSLFSFKEHTEWLLSAAECESVYNEHRVFSPYFKIMDFESASKTVDNKEKFRRIGLFEVASLRSGCLLFCGGPIVSLDWCPFVDETSLDRKICYLALSCRPKGTFTCLKTSNAPASIHLWRVYDSITEATLVVSLSIEGGPVWDLKWCPARCFSLNNNIKDDLHSENGLGIIAAACGDGAVRMYALSLMKQFLPTATASSSKSKTFSKKCNLKLLVYNNDSRGSPCFRLDWCRSNGNRTVAALFGDGLLSTWNVVLPSTFLCDEDLNTNERILYANRVFQAHHAQGTAVLFFPHSDRYIWSSGKDRTLQLWDLEEVVPVSRNATKVRAVVSDICVPPCSQKIIRSFDYSLCNTSAQVIMRDHSLLAAEVSLYDYNTSFTSLDCDEVFCGIACGTDDGLVTIANWMAMSKRKKNRKDYRRLLLCLDPVSLSKNNDEDEGVKDIFSLSDYSSLCKDIGLVFKEGVQNKHGFLAAPSDFDHSRTNILGFGYPFASINKIKWHKTFGSFSIVACGLEAGFIYIKKLTSYA